MIRPTQTLSGHLIPRNYAGFLMAGATALPRATRRATLTGLPKTPENWLRSGYAEARNKNASWLKLA